MLSFKACRSHTPGPTGTPQARIVLQQVYCLGLLYQLTGNLTFANRGIEEILNAAQAAQWDTNGTVQLNTGEMLHATAMAYDWFYDVLNQTSKDLLVNAIINTGLVKVREAFNPNPPFWAGAFMNTTSNWASVILGGSIMGALAVIGDSPDIVPAWVSGSLLPQALVSIQETVGGWGPDPLEDGAWPEGPNYAGYGARYLAPTTMSLITATGSPDAAGLLSIPGLERAPYFLIYSMANTSPDLEYFYWGDTRTEPETISQYLAFAGYFNQNATAYGIRLLTESIYVSPNTSETVSMNAPVALIYFTDIGSESDYRSLPLISKFKRDQLVTSRTSWNNDPSDENNVYIGFKGSNISWSWAHNHLDQGHFVFSARGQYFAQDLGSDNYDAPSYFWVNRFQLYRTGTIGHNTFSFDGKNARCVITGTYSTNCSISPIVVYNVTGTSTSPRRSSDSDSGSGSSGSSDGSDSYSSKPGSETPVVVASSSALAVDAFAIVNLTDAYGYLGVSSALRGFIIAQGRNQLITMDEAVLSGSSRSSNNYDHDNSNNNHNNKNKSTIQDQWWSMHTIANISISADGNTATLTTWNVSVPFTVTILSNQVGGTVCPGTTFSITPIALPPPQLESPDLQRLTISAPAATCVRLAVAIGVAPVTEGFTLRPLSEWESQGVQE